MDHVADLERDDQGTKTKSLSATTSGTDRNQFEEWVDSRAGSIIFTTEAIPKPASFIHIAIVEDTRRLADTSRRWNLPAKFSNAQGQDRPLTGVPGHQARPHLLISQSWAVRRPVFLTWNHTTGKIATSSTVQIRPAHGLIVESIVCRVDSN